MYASDIKLNNEGWRPLPEGGRLTVLMPPGTYTVKLIVDGQEAGSQSLKVLKDPNAGTTEADIQQQTSMLLDLRKDLEAAADIVNQIENMRAQLTKLRAEHADLKTAADDFEKKLTDIEDGLIQRRYTGQGQDTTRFPAGMIGNMGYLAGGVAGGDFPPNKQQQEVHAMYKTRLADLRKRLDAVTGSDLSNFNKMLKDKNISTVISGQ
jgi:DNA repair exonuclease SbcCD ATPase subunit